MHIVCAAYTSNKQSSKHRQFSVACRQSQTTTTDHPHPSAGSASAPARVALGLSPAALGLALGPLARPPRPRARPRCAACRIHVYVRATHALTKKAQASSCHLVSLRQFDVIWHS